MKISDILKVENIKIDFMGTSKTAILNEMIDSFTEDPRIVNVETVRTVVLEREKIMSTGVGNGFAIPHGKTDMIKEMVAGFGLLKNPVEFDATDNKPVKLIFLLVGQADAVGQHLKMLSRVSRIMNQANIRTKLANANSSQEILQIFEKEDEKYLELQ